MAFAPDGRLFLCLQAGQVRIVKNGVLLNTPFMTLTTPTDGERGLLGIAFDPNFTINHYLYFYYTVPTPAVHNRVSRFTANGDVVLPGSETVLLELDNLNAAQHNGGALHFGSDGKLYIAVGDNYDGTNAQTLTNLKGKVLRINADGTIPADNPFIATTTGKNQAIWAYGLRNPFTFDVQPGTGRIFVNDVGEAHWEEINGGIAGANYGWPTTEGYTNDPQFVSPLFAYGHGAGDLLGCAITGGGFYNPVTPQFPDFYVGKYFFVDYCNDWMRVFDFDNNSVMSFATGLSTYPLNLTLGLDGSLYYLSYSDATTPGFGGLYKITYTGSQTPSIEIQPASRTVSQGQIASFFISASGDQPLAYQWQKSTDGGTTFTDITGATSNAYQTPPTTLSDSGSQFQCVVSNSFGTVTSNPATLTVTPNQPPTCTIDVPTAGAMYNDGDTISYSGSASDPEDGTLPASAFTWEVHLQHDQHFHPFVPATSGSTGGSFTIPTSGETDDDVWFRIYLTVTDSGGLTTTITRDIFPNKSTLNLATNPPGLQVTLDGQPTTTPASVLSVVGLTRTLGVVSPQTLNGVSYVFDSWSDGGAATHTITTPSANASYTANYRVSSGTRAGSLTANPNPIQVCDGTGLGVTTLSWTSTGTTMVEVHIGSPTGALFARSGPGTASATTGKWVKDGTVFYLQDISGGLPLTSDNTLATITVNIVASDCNNRAGSMTANPNPMQACDYTGLGATTLSWSSTGTTMVEIHIGSPTGALFARTGSGAQSATTGRWVKNGTVFYLQDVSGGLPLNSDNTLTTVTLQTTTAGCGTGGISADPNPIHICDGTGLGATTLSWNSSGVLTVEVHVGSPSGPLFARTGPGPQSGVTSKSIADGTVVYLQDVSNGLPLTASNTLATALIRVDSDGCVSITQQPTDQTAPVGGSATFTVVAQGVPSPSFRWQRNGSDIPGATSASYTLSPVAATDNGAQFRCIVANDSNSITSSSATLMVTANLTLSSGPPGLQLSYDNQPLTAPATGASVIGSVHTVGAFSPQTLNGVSYVFSNWSDGGASTHDITTPNGNATYTAMFAAANRSGSISGSPNPIQVCDGSGAAATTLSWNSSSTSVVEVHIGSPSGTLFARSGPGPRTATTGKWVTNGMIFYLQDVSNGLPLTSANTLGTVTVNLTTNGCIGTGTISASPNPIKVCDGTGKGVTMLSWNSSSTSVVEVHIGSPSGTLFARSGPGPRTATTGKWVTNGMIFYLQDVSNGLPLTSANTLGTVRVNLITNGCSP
jgi:glucose/arabinose dehydrogenase